MKILENLDIEQKNIRKDLRYKTGDTKKHRVYDFQKCKIMQTLGISISNGTITLDVAINDQVYLKMELIILKNLDQDT